MPREFVEDRRQPERHLWPLEAGVLGLDGVVAQEPRGLVDQRSVRA
jgi:hypothetical protein